MRRKKSFIPYPEMSWEIGNKKFFVKRCPGRKKVTYKLFNRKTGKLIKTFTDALHALREFRKLSRPDLFNDEL